MKEAFEKGKVKTADWVHAEEGIDIGWFKDKGQIIVKPRGGSRGSGIHLLSSTADLEKWAKGRDMDDYIAERYHNYTREYRLHVTETGCFYTCRKMLKRDADPKTKFIRNDANCVWVLDTNPDFDRPSNFATIEAECVKALKAVGLDFGACDVRVQSATDSKGKARKDPKFIIVEINSAPSFGEITLEKYLEVLPSLLRVKYNKSLKK